MKKLFIAMIAVALVGGTFIGCKKGGGSADTSGPSAKAPKPALTIKDGAKKFFRFQGTCPVCGKPISGDFYADTDNGRIYFDKKECQSKFKEDPEKFIKQFKEKVMGGAANYEQQMREAQQQGN